MQSVVFLKDIIVNLMTVMRNCWLKLQKLYEVEYNVSKESTTFIHPSRSKISTKVVILPCM